MENYKAFSKPVKVKRRIAQIAVGQIGIGEISAPTLFALTCDGEIWLRRFDGSSIEEPQWTLISELPDKDLAPVPDL